MGKLSLKECVTVVTDLLEGSRLNLLDDAYSMTLCKKSCICFVSRMRDYGCRVTYFFK
jgi:hypothetical protein